MRVRVRVKVGVRVRVRVNPNADLNWKVAVWVGLLRRLAAHRRPLGQVSSANLRHGKGQLGLRFRVGVRARVGVRPRHGRA